MHFQGTANARSSCPGTWTRSDGVVNAAHRLAPSPGQGTGHGWADTVGSDASRPAPPACPHASRQLQPAVVMTVMPGDAKRSISTSASIEAASGIRRWMSLPGCNRPLAINPKTASKR